MGWREDCDIERENAVADYEANEADEQAQHEADPQYQESVLGVPAAAFDDAWAEDADNYPDTSWDEDDGRWNPVEQGMYDDDPSPYAGDYSEM
jgi:hypothetical protein